MPATDRASATQRVSMGLMLLLAAAAALFNGWDWSPLYDPVGHVLYQAMRSYPFISAQRAFDITPAAIAIITLLLAGIPAAIYERIRGLQTSTPVSIAIWLVATLVLALPTILTAFGGD